MSTRTVNRKNKKVHVCSRVEYNTPDTGVVLQSKYMEPALRSAEGVILYTDSADEYQTVSKAKKRKLDQMNKKSKRKHFALSNSEEKDVKPQFLPTSEQVSSEKSDLSDSAEEEDEYTSIKRELAEMSFEYLQKLKERLGTKVYNQVVHGRLGVEQKKRVFKRENKNRPMEMSSKKPVPFLRPVVEMKKKVQRDPRFDDLSGTYSESHFQKSYSFLDEVKDREKQKLQKSLRKESNPEKREKLKYLLNRMNQQELNKKQQQKSEELEKALRKKERELVNEGKTPFFLKKAERKKLELAEKFRELKKSGKVDTYLQKKRKKTAQKSKKHLPNNKHKYN